MTNDDLNLVAESFLVDGEFGGAMDATDERDYLAGSISTIDLTPVAELPEKLDFDRSAITLLSQKNTMSCTAQGAANAAELTYFNLYGKKIHIPVLGEGGMWDYQLDVHPKTGSRTLGDYTRSAMRALVHRSENGGIPVIDQDSGDAMTIEIPAFALVEKHADTIRQWLFAGYAVLISGDVLVPEMGRSNWTITKQEGYLTFPEGWRKKGGHAVCILTGYDWSDGKKEFVVANSYGDNYGYFGNGTFRIRANQIKGLHPSCWVCFPDGINVKQEILTAANLKRKMRAIWNIADKATPVSAVCENQLAIIKGAASYAADEARKILKLR